MVSGKAAMGILTLYHGAKDVVSAPTLGQARPHKDFGPGFYVTPHRDFAAEWACRGGRDGVVCAYKLDDTGLGVLDLTDGTHGLLLWVALLLAHRRFDLKRPVVSACHDYLLERFMPSLDGVDLVRGYRADDSRFSYVRAFVENSLPLAALGEAVRLGGPGEQVALVSEAALSRLAYEGCHKVSAAEHYPRSVERDRSARRAFWRLASGAGMDPDALDILDILRKEMGPDDLCL